MLGGRKVWRKCCKCLFGEKSLANLQFTKKPYKERGYCSYNYTLGRDLLVPLNFSELLQIR